MTEDERRALFQKALDVGGNTHSIEDVVALVKDGRARFWGNGDGSVVTEILEFPQFKAINYWLVSGNLKECLALEPEISSWGSEQGCTVATASGRRGFGRAAAHLGWRERGYLFWKPLT